MALGLCALAAPALSGCGAAVASGHATRARSARAGAPAGPLGPAVDAFGFDLLRRLGGGNVVFSPDSVAAALAMAGTGANGQTAVQMAHVLRLSSPGTFPEIGRLQSSISAEQLAAGHGNPEAPTLEIANGLFVQQELSLLSPFLSGLQSAFAAVPQSVDFHDGGAEAVHAINTWVGEHTHGLIPQIVASLPEQTLLALANAVYLKAAWLDPFKASETATARFHGLHQTAAVPFMHQTERLPYGRGKGYAAVELPYAGSTLSLLAVMPVGQSIGSLQSRLNAGSLAQIVSRLATKTVALSLPRFKLEYHVELGAPLRALGMTDAFSENANFSGIAASPPLKLGVVEHAANFSLNEQGTVAAAATVVTAEPTSAQRFVGPIVKFDLNKPFLFLLRDDRTGTILFAGRLSEPVAGPTT